MKLSHREDIAVPADFVFGRITDFNGMTRKAMRKGAHVQRLDRLSEPGVGMSWKANFTYRGRERELTSVVTAFERPGGFAVESIVGGLESVTVVDLLALSPTQTRLTLSVSMNATSMTARLLLQSLKLARGTLAKRLGVRMSDLAKSIEADFRDARSA